MKNSEPVQDLDAGRAAVAVSSGLIATDIDTALTHPDVALTVFVVDDDPDIRSSLPRALRKRGYDVEAFASAYDFLAVYDGERPGCLVLDYGMPGMTGLELQQQLISRNYAIPIIFISGHGGVQESVQAIKGGAIDFLEKPFRQAILIERIDQAFAMALRMRSTRQRDRQTRARFDRLTTREKEIVERVVTTPSEISSKEIGAYLGISPRTVDHHRARIFEKLGVRSMAELIAMARTIGPVTQP